MASDLVTFGSDNEQNKFKDLNSGLFRLVNA